MESHVRILAILRIVAGCLGILVATAALLAFGGLAGLLAATEAAREAEAWIAVPVLAAIGGALFFLILVVSLPSIIAGAGLLKYRPWARILTIVLSAIDLLNVPLGTALGIYGLWVLLARDSQVLFERRFGPLA
jgi:hypothetical protein